MGDIANAVKMPKPSSAEYQRHMVSQAMVCHQIDHGHGHGPLDDHDHLIEAHQGHVENGATGSDSGPDPPDDMTTSTSFNISLKIPSATCFDPPFASSLCTITPSSDDPSQSVSDDEPFLEGRIYTPKKAEELSVRNDGHCAATRREDGQNDEVDGCPEGMALEAYGKGPSIYHVTDG